MPIDNLNFSGINRAVSDYGNAGSCEELINLRPTANGLEPVKPFVELFENRGYDRVYVHKAVGSNNYIAIKSGTGMVIVYRVDAESGPVQTLFYFGPPANFSLDDISVAYTGNYILFSICDKEDNYYENYAFLWDGTSYKAVNADAPTITYNITTGTGSVQDKRGLPNVGISNAEHMAFVESLSSAFNAIQETNPNLCFGPIIIAIAFKTNDGETFWTGHWRIFDPTPYYRIMSDTNYMDYSDLSNLPDFRSVYGSGYRAYKHIPDTGIAYLAGIPVSIILKESGWDKDTSMIKSVEVYASAPTIYNDPNILLDPENGLVFNNYYYGYSDLGDWITVLCLPQTPFKEMGLEGKLLYLQKSITLDELEKAGNDGVSFSLKFGGSKQKVEKTLEIDAGWTTRYGTLLSYNSRFHFYDSVSKIKLGYPYMLCEGNPNTNHHVYAVFDDGERSRTMYIGDISLPTDGPYLMIAGSSRVTSIIISRSAGGDTELFKNYPMTPSTTYNYSINFGDHTSYYAGTDPESETGDTVIIKEPDAINVTEQYNPFVFDVMNSYLAPGKIIDVQPQLVAVKDVSFGDYPLNVFTNRGTYALLQGSGAVLYGNWRSVSNLVSQSNCVPTDSGTFFLAAGSLWLLAGSAAVQVSDALSRGPHKYIRSCEKYVLLSKSETGYDISGYESVVPFDEYTKGAFLSYNIFRDEIFVSNPNYGYSYVISLKYRQWFKVNYQIKQYSIGDNIAMTVDNTIGGTTSNTTWDSYTIKLSLTVRLGEYDTYSYTMNLSPEEQDNPALVCENFTSAWQAVHAGTPVEEVELDYLSGLTPGTGSFSVENIPYRPDAAATMWTENDSSVRVEYDFTMIPTFHRVIDLSQELSVVPGSNTTQSVLVHMQSRPFSNGYQYTHVHRIVSMVRAALGQNDKMIVALYGSDDLRNWNLLSYASRANVTVSQIRTASAARSWRYYTICIGGVIPVDTVMGPVLVEQQPVVRRIG